MKLSEIKQSDVVDFLRLEEDEYNPLVLNAIMKAANAYILDNTGLTAEEADKHEDFYTAFMVLCQDMNDNRSMYVDKSNVNKVVDSIIGCHAVNLI